MIHNGSKHVIHHYESVGRGFESLPSHQEKPVHIVCWFFLVRWKGLEQGGGA